MPTASGRGRRTSRAGPTPTRATGDYLWQVDIDEFYRDVDMHTVLGALRRNAGLTAVSFKMLTFWGDLGYAVDGWELRRGKDHYHRLFKWGPGYSYRTHRPPTVCDEHGVDLRELRLARRARYRRPWGAALPLLAPAAPAGAREGGVLQTRRALESRGGGLGHLDGAVVPDDRATVPGAQPAQASELASAIRRRAPRPGARDDERHPGRARRGRAAGRPPMSNGSCAPSGTHWGAGASSSETTWTERRKPCAIRARRCGASWPGGAGRWRCEGPLADTHPAPGGQGPRRDERRLDGGPSRRSRGSRARHRADHRVVGQRPP